MGVTQEIGNRGEELAAQYLLAEGYEILERNWRAGRYEIDIIARRDGVLHIVEVKSRGYGSLTSPEEAMTGAKFHALVKAARSYLAEHSLDIDTRFDLVAVTFPATAPASSASAASPAAEVKFYPDAAYPRW